MYRDEKRNESGTSANETVEKVLYFREFKKI